MKEFWTTQCMYKGDFPSRRAFVLSTFDPPCAGDAYDESQRELVRESFGKLVLIVSTIALIIGLGWLGLGWIQAHR